jgi:nucleoside-diphosphate-sugar epimerase
LAKVTLKRGKGFQVEGGQNLWTMVHVQDLSNVCLRLVEEAVKGGGNATWGPEGHYFAENGGFVWGDMAKAIAKNAHKKKLIPIAEIENVTLEEADKLVSHGSRLGV